jgi:hypothetical protein
LSHFIDHLTRVDVAKSPDLTNAKGIPREVVFVRAAMPLMTSTSSVRALGVTESASLHLRDDQIRTSSEPISNLSAAVPSSLSIQDSRYTTKLNGNGAASFLTDISEGIV